MRCLTCLNQLTVNESVTADFSSDMTGRKTHPISAPVTLNLLSVSASQAKYVENVFSCLTICVHVSKWERLLMLQ